MHDDSDGGLDEDLDDALVRVYKRQKWGSPPLCSRGGIVGCASDG
jgi:hypothetical protein